MAEMLQPIKGGPGTIAPQAGAKSKYREAKVLNDLFGSGTPATLYFAAFTVMPPQTSDTATEPVGNNYSRVAVTNNVTNFPAATLTPDQTAYQKINGTAIVFPTPSGSWGAILGIGIYDASTGGNLQYILTRATTTIVNAASPLVLSASVGMLITEA